VKTKGERIRAGVRRSEGPNVGPDEGGVQDLGLKDANKPPPKPRGGNKESFTNDIESNYGTNEQKSKGEWWKRKDIGEKKKGSRVRTI